MNICIFSLNRSNNSILIFQILSVIFTIILGTVLHFTYQWSNQNILIGTFSAVNESTWEHLKLLFFPMLITTIVGYFYIGKDVSNFLCAKTIGIIVAMSFTVIFFYTYTGVLGINFAVLNILTFIFSVILGDFIAYKIMTSNFSCNNRIAIITLIILFFCFLLFTFFPPNIGLFKSLAS